MGFYLWWHAVDAELMPTVEQFYRYYCMESMLNEIHVAELRSSKSFYGRVKENISKQRDIEGNLQIIV